MAGTFFFAFTSTFYEVVGEVVGAPDISPTAPS
jgi:hypothetical protein